MKELSIEEKTKAYDGNYKVYTELINRLEDVKGAIKKQNYGIAMDILCNSYPVFQITTSSELKESEDERIRKELISFFTERAKYTEDSTFNGLSSKEIISWLEKQGEIIKNNMLLPFKEYDNLMESINKRKKEGYEAGYKQGLIDSKNEHHVQPKFKVGDVIRPKGSTAEYTIESISGECYHGKGWGLIIGCDDDYELVRQKSASWSKEDEQYLLVCKNALAKYQVSDKWDATIISRWLEDKLKSLRPQNTWKPSDLPHWKKSTLPNDNTTGFNSDYFCHKGYCINYKELFDKLPKDD